MVINTHGNTEIQHLIERNMKENLIDPTSFKVLGSDTLDFLHKSFTYPFEDTKECVRHIYISKFLQDLAFISRFLSKYLYFLYKCLYIYLYIFFSINRNIYWNFKCF